MDFIPLFELGLTALALFITAINWLISQKLNGFDDRIVKLEQSFTDINRIHLDLELHKQKLDFVITMLTKNNGANK